MVLIILFIGVLVVSFVGLLIWLFKTEQFNVPHLLCSLLIIVFSIMFIILTIEYHYERLFEQNKETIHIKPTIKYFEKQADKIMIVVDDTTLYKTHFKWLDTNSIMAKIEYYKGRTNTIYIIKE